MKTTKLIITSLVVSSLVMGSATIGFNKTVAESSDSKVNLAIESNEDVYGLQFEIKYNTDELVLNSITSKVDGLTFEYREKDSGIVKGLLFSMQGIAISNSDNLSNLLEFDFSEKDNFNGSSTVEFIDIILAGQHGSSIDVSASNFDVNTNIVPVSTNLGSNYPNPFNPTTSIDYSIGESGMTSLTIYDLNGAVVKNLVSQSLEAGNYQAVWNATNNNGNPVASGRYILKMTAPNYSETITMTLLK